MIDLGRGRESVTDADRIRRDASFLALGQRAPLSIDAADGHALDVLFAVDGTHVPSAICGHRLECQPSQPGAAASETARLPRHGGQRLDPGMQRIWVADRDDLTAGIDDQPGHRYGEWTRPDNRHTPAGKHAARLQHERCRAQSHHPGQRPARAWVKPLDGAGRNHQRSTLRLAARLGGERGYFKARRIVRVPRQRADVPDAVLEGELGAARRELRAQRPSFGRADLRSAGVLPPRIRWTMNPPAGRPTLVEHKYG